MPEKCADAAARAIRAIHQVGNKLLSVPIGRCSDASTGETAMSVARSALMTKPIAAPTAYSLTRELDGLDLTMQGEQVRIAAGRLRAGCKCAHCVRARIDGVFPERFDGIAIVQVAPIGDYAINIGFSDGHARGIYPWGYLVELSAA